MTGNRWKCINRTYQVSLLTLVERFIQVSIQVSIQVRIEDVCQVERLPMAIDCVDHRAGECGT